MSESSASTQSGKPIGILDGEEVRITRNHLLFSGRTGPLEDRGVGPCVRTNEGFAFQIRGTYAKALINLSGGCNLHCPYCLFDCASLEEGGFLPIDLLRGGVCDLLGALRVEQCWLSGGEPTCHPHFGQALWAISRIVPQVTVITNGATLGNEEIRRSISECRAACQISLAGIKRDDMRALHGDAHSAVLGTAERLREMLPDNRLVLSVLLTSLAGSSPTEMADWAYERGYDEVIFTFVKPEGRARLRPDLRLSLKRRIELAAEISQVNGRNGIPVYLCGGIPDSRDEWKGRAGGSFRFPDCLHACEEIQILSNGTVLPCGVMYNDRLDVEHWPGVSRFLSAILDHRSTYLIRSPGFACPNLATVSPNENHHLASA